MARVRSKAAALLVASAAVALTAACGGGSDDTPGGDAPDNAFAAYTQCLQQNGVTITMPSGGPSGGASRAPGALPSGMPRPSGSAGQRGGGGFPGGGMFAKPADVDEATWTKAQQACASLRPSGRPGGGQGRGQNAAYENCLKENGVTTTDGRPNTTDPTTKKTMETCAVLREAPPSATPTT